MAGTVKNIYVLGAGGSIGSQTLEILKNNPQFKVIGLSLSRHDDINLEILKNFQPEIAALRTKEQVNKYLLKYPHIKWVYGEEGLIEIAKYPKTGMLVNALSGSAGLKPTVAAIKSGKDIALANKETLVMAGHIIMDLANKYQVMLLPIDSEHYAIWQLLNGVKRDDVEKIAITASGGALRHLSRRDLRSVRPQDALKHPNWQMGSKITIDSATMVNKGLEVIEAHHLFGFDYGKIETILHDESLVHAIIYLKDGTTKMHISKNDMKIPIRNVLYYPQEITFQDEIIVENLTFKKMDEIRFPLINIAYEVGKIGGILPTVFNAANEAAVDLFLREKISFLEIESIIIKYTLTSENIDNPSLEEIVEIDKAIKKSIYQRYDKE